MNDGSEGVGHLGELSKYLTDATTAQSGVGLMFNALPESTGVITAVEELRGSAPHLVHSTSFIAKPRFRFTTRSAAPTSTQGDYVDPTAARTMSQQMWRACMDLIDMTLQSTAPPSTGRWLFLTPECNPYLAGRDQQSRVHFVFDASGERQGP